jgi:hypothetical protein
MARLSCVSPTSQEQNADAFDALRGATGLPVSADLESHGASPEEAAHVIARAGRSSFDCLSGDRRSSGVGT